MEINDVLPLKAARRDAIANLKSFWGTGHQRPNIDGFVYIHHAAPPYSSHINAICLLLFRKVWLDSVCHVQRLATKQLERRIYGGWVKTLVLL